VYALGHSNRTLEEFLAILQAHGIEQIADIRTVPKSRTVPWAHIDRLPDLLGEAGIQYTHIAELGGLRKPRPDSRNDAWRNLSFRGYADHMQTPAFEAGLQELLAFARERPTAMMCAEAVPWRCHRSLVADALVARGVPVIQVTSATSAKPHAVTSFARIREGRVTYPSGPQQQRLPE